MSGGFEIRGRFRCFFAVQLFGNLRIHNIGTKCNSLTQQFIGISTTIGTWATCFDSIESSSGPQRLQIQLLQGGQVHCGIPNAYTIVP